MGPDKRVQHLPIPASEVGGAAPAWTHAPPLSDPQHFPTPSRARSLSLLLIPSLPGPLLASVCSAPFSPPRSLSSATLASRLRCAPTLSGLGLGSSPT